MKVGDPIVFTAQWSSFYGFRGRVVATSPHLMVLLDGDRSSIRVSEREVALDEPSTVNLTGAE